MTISRFLLRSTAAALGGALAGPAMAEPARTGEGRPALPLLVRQDVARAAYAQLSSTADAGEITLDTITVQSESARPTSVLGPPPPAYAGGQVATGARIGVLGNRPVLDTPLSVVPLTREFIENQQARTANDILRRDPSVQTSNSRVSGSDGVAIRGFRSFPYEWLYDGGFTPMNRRYPVEFMERVDILKGPTSFVAGVPFFGGVGGIVSYTSKKPLDESLTRVTATYDSRSVVGTHLDVSRRFGPDGAFGIRFNGVVRGGELSQDNVDTQDFIGHLALSYRGDSFRANLQYAHIDSRIDGAAFGYGLSPGQPVPKAPSGRKFAGPDWSFSEYRYRFARAQAELDLAPDWTLSGTLGATTHREEFVNPITTINGPFGRATTTVYPQFGRSEPGDYYTADTTLRGRVETGPVKHNLTLSASQTWYREGFRGASVLSPTAPFAFSIYQPGAQSTFTPILADDGRYYPLFDNLARGAAISDEVSLLEDRVLLTGGLRYINLEQKNFTFAGPSPNGGPNSAYELNRWMPLAGIVVKPLENVSLFANYVEAVERGGIAPFNAVNRDATVPPLISRQVEAGVKVDFGTVGLTVAAFEIKKPTTFVDPATLEFGALGDQTHRGVEVIGFGEPVAGLRFLAGYAYIDPELSRTAGGRFDGNVAPGVPQHTVRLSGEWDVPQVAGLTLLANANLASSQYFDPANTQSIPAYATFDLGARYAFKTASGQPVTLRLNVENVLDRGYWETAFNNGLKAGNPRTFRLATTFDF